jgi:phosphoribosylformimino-5-aminoimidazole carboxamide ribotide isomerase
VKTPAQIPGRIAGIDARRLCRGRRPRHRASKRSIWREFEDSGVAAIVYTDIDRDGIMTGQSRLRSVSPSRPLGDRLRWRLGLSDLEGSARRRIEGVICGRTV